MITVTGATGNVGRVLVELLAEAGEEVAALSRTPRPPRPAGGVRWYEGGLASAADLRPALAGSRALFLLLGGALNVTGEPPRAVLDAAAEAGVERVVLVSSQANATRPEAPSHARLRDYEAAVRDSGLAYTILRPSAFASNALAWAETVRTKRTVFTPFPDVALPVVDPADIAAVAALALREPGHESRTYELTGPAPNTPRAQAAAIAAALGEEVALTELTREEARAAMSQAMPPEVVATTLALLSTPTPREQSPTATVPTLLHRPATPFRTWAARHAQPFR
jgi:uncharacterized protein YbjT (DUF2867 family)